MESFGTLLICLFDRPVDQVKLRAPPEGVHFGFDEDDELHLTKKRRRISGGDIGTEINENPLTAAPYRAGRGDGVLDVQALAKFFADSFGMRLNSDNQSKLPPFTAAEFALQMVAGVDEVIFTLSS